MIHSLILVVASLTTIPDGSLIFLEHSNNIVENETESPITHVGIVIDNNIYEATKPRIRKVSIDEFKRKNRKFKIYIKNPEIPFTVTEVSILKDYLESQIRRKYSVWGYITGHEVKGMHCGELIANALSKTGRYTFKEPWNIVPKDLWELVGYRIDI